MLAVSVTGNDPAAVGVPLITPLLALNARPGGRLPVIESVGGGTPVAANVKLYAVPTTPLGGVPLVIEGAAGAGAMVIVAA